MDSAVAPVSDPTFSTLSNASLQDAITELAACITVATARLLAMIAELDRRQGWGDWGLKSCAHWLNWKCGIGLGAAREKVRVARALQALPEITAAFANGEISYSKVRAMTRVATEENESYLLMIARHGTAAHLESLVRGYRRVQRNIAREQANDNHAARKLEWLWDDDGSLIIKARLPAESGALFLKALEKAQDVIEPVEDPENVSAETSTEHYPFAARRADALVEVAEGFLSGGKTTSATADRFQVIVTPESLQDALPSIEHGPTICHETAQRLSCDARARVLELDESGDPLNVGRKTRVVPYALRRALIARDGGCRFPGCTQHRDVDAHHIKHWANGGETSLENLVLLCRHHHRLLHEGGFRIERRDDNKMLFFTPNGHWVPDAPPQPLPSFDVGTVVTQSGKHVSAETLLPRWSGERMDVGMAVEGLVHSAVR